MHLSAYGQFAHDQWLALTGTYPLIALGEFVIMPNHMHGMIYVEKWDYGVDAGNGTAGGGADGHDEAEGGKHLPYVKKDGGTVRERLAPSHQDTTTRRIATGPPTISAIIGAYKSLTHRDSLTLAKENNVHLGKLWHRSFYETIIRTPEAAKHIRQYIRNNVRTWARDKFHEGG
ncbi:MAG: REP element-mobilizing transposase RayT [Neolewinella sp.]|jgi:putative transposase